MKRLWNLTHDENHDYDGTLPHNVAPKSNPSIEEVKLNLDVVGAYFNSKLHETVYMTIPEGINVDRHMFICKLKKSLYGLKLSGRNWCEFLRTLIRFMV